MFLPKARLYSLPLAIYRRLYTFETNNQLTQGYVESALDYSAQATSTKAAVLFMQWIPRSSHGRFIQEHESVLSILADTLASKMIKEKITIIHEKHVLNL